MTPYELAQRFVGEIREIPGDQHSPFIQWAFMSCGYGPDTPDETPWCSAFANRVAWLTRSARSKSAAARSWLGIGQPQTLDTAIPGYDVVIVKQNAADPGPEATNVRGHVGFYAGHDLFKVYLLGGNQSNGVSVAPFPVSNILGIRRLN